ncbi:MAG: antibiotic biosynthesis monooxygenase [Bacteroidetes bacterium]|nr:MAG: antibiotic biosynthesis monooxygenase [Bacteroidota bacterium]
MSSFAQTPKPPYYAVIFTSVLNSGDNGYHAMAEKMLELAATMPGYLGVESAREEIGLTVSYWESEEAIAQWKAHSLHQLAQEKGKAEWYAKFQVRVAKVERDYDFTSGH